MRHHKMEDLALAAGQDPKLLLRRPRGRAVYPQLEAAMKDTREGELLLISFSDDQDCDPSFIDETLVKLAQQLLEGNFGEKGLAICGLNESVQLSLMGTLSLRREDAKKLGKEFKVVFLVFEAQPLRAELPLSSCSIIGHFEQSLLEVFTLLLQRKSLSAADLVKELGLEISSASMRLRRLHERHLVHRQYQTLSNGREYVYVFWE